MSGTKSMQRKRARVKAGRTLRTRLRKKKTAGEKKVKDARSRKMQ